MIKKYSIFDADFYLGMLFSPLLLVFFINLSKFTDNLTLYFLFNFFSFILFFKIISRRSFFFERFLSFYLFMGFFVKLHYSELLIPNYFNTLGIKTLIDKNIIKQTMLVSVLSLFIFIAVSFLYKRYLLFNRKSKYMTQSLRELSKSINLYNINFKKIYIAYLILATIFISFNLKYNIYSKGNVSAYPGVIIFAFKYFLTLGLPFIFLSILHFEIIRRKAASFFLIIYTIVENFLISFSMLSRNLIINLSVFFVGYFSVRDKDNYDKKNNISMLILFFSVFIAATISLSILLVEKKRGIHFSNVSINSPVTSVTNIQTFSYQFHYTNLTSLFLNPKIRALLIDRWVGLDALVAVVAHSDKNFHFFYLALKEKDINSLSFFDKNLIDSPYKNIDNSKKHFITVPGFLAFLYYPGSLFFFIPAVSMFIFFGYYFEELALNLSYKNEMIAAFVANMVAYRFINFGYAPLNSIIFIFAILLTLLGYYFFIKLIEAIK